MKVAIRPGPISQSYQARYLLVPSPPSTPEQIFVGVESSCGCDPTVITAQNGRQQAFLLDVPASGKAELVFHFKEPGSRDVNKEQFAVVQSPLTEPSTELAAYVHELTVRHVDPAHKLNVLIDFTSCMFDYDHPERPFHYGENRIPLLTQLTKGNCADIHGFLLSCMYAAGLDGSYYSGFYFPETQNQATGFHCWLGSNAGGFPQYWDVAQHLKHDVAPVRSGLNPLGGRRIAMSTGRGLLFNIDGMDIQLSHFSYPMWIYEDGVANGFGATARILDSTETRIECDAILESV